MLVYGISGTGKSSLIHCGLANKFQETDWLPIVIRRGGNIIESVAAGIRSASITEQQSKLVTPADFKKGVRSLYLDHYKPVFFIFDQFEELFIFGDKEERKLFVNIVKSLFESDLQCRLIFIMREEYMAGVTEFEKYISTFFANRVRIEKMSHVNALEAIKGPCKVFNISLEEGFAENLLEKLSPGETDVELTYLQVFLDKIYRLAVGILPPPGGEFKGGLSYDLESKGSLSFTLELLNKTGNVSDLLGSFLEEQLSLLDNPETALAVLKSFVSIKGTKQPMRPEEVREYSLTLGKNIDEQVLVELIQTFVNLRVLRDKDQNGCYELRHDALATKIFEKFTLTEKELLEVRRFVENSYYAFEKRGVFMNKQDLDYLSSYENNLILPQNLNEFVSKSKAKLVEQKRNLRRITSLTALIFVLIIAAIGRFYIRSLGSPELSNSLGLALIKSEKNPVEAVLTELNIWEEDSSSSQLLGIILKDFQNISSMTVDSSDPVFELKEYLKPFSLISPVSEAGISDKGNYIFGFLENKKVFLINLHSNKVYYIEPESEPDQIYFSEKDSSLAIVFKNSNGEVCDNNGTKRFTFETTLNKVMNNKLVMFFKKGSNDLVTVKDNEAIIFDNAGTIIYELKGHKGRVNAVDISPDERFIVTAASDKKAYFWNLNQQTKQYCIYDSLIGHTDTIWSCRFNKSGKYVITASADRTIRIWNLNGKQINPDFSFLPNADNHYRNNNGEPDDDASNPKYSYYYRKFCDASFSPDEKEIIATGYSIDNKSINDNNINFSKVMFYDQSKKFANGFGRSYFFGETDAIKVIPRTFRSLRISPYENVAAAVDALSDTVYLLSGNGMPLLTLPGNEALFSNSGNELFWISGNEILRMPVTPKEIKYLLDKFKIMGSQGKTEEKFLEL
jgi:WD40 repeat protein